MENKNGYFVLKIGIPENKIENSVDLVLASMGVEENSEENFIKDDNSRLIYIFKTKQRIWFILGLFFGTNTDNLIQIKTPLTRIKKVLKLWH